MEQKNDLILILEEEKRIIKNNLHLESRDLKTIVQITPAEVNCNNWMEYEWQLTDITNKNDTLVQQLHHIHFEWNNKSIKNNSCKTTSNREHKEHYHSYNKVTWKEIKGEKWHTSSILL